MAARRLAEALALATVVALVSSSPAAARQDRRLDAPYTAAVVAFQRDGDTVPARRLATSWTHQQFEAAVARTRRDSPQLARPASLLHLELALAMVESDPDEALWHVRLGQQLLEPLSRAHAAAQDDFVARWSVVTSTVFQARTDLSRARAALAFGLQHRPRDARVRQHAAMIEDLESLLTDNDDMGLADRRSTAARRAAYRHMASAEREYRAALEISPGLAPARIRLGRLLHRRDRLVEARQEFERARAAVLTTGERYLLLLFLASTYEALGEDALARTALQEAVRLAGTRQVGWLALAQFEERTGHPDRARGVIAQSLARGRQTDADEWWDYRHGGFDREGLEWLRDVVRSSR